MSRSLCQRCSIYGACSLEYDGKPCRKEKEVSDRKERTVSDSFYNSLCVHQLIEGYEEGHKDGYEAGKRDTASPWHRVEEEGLPKETRCYIVYLRQGTEVETPEWMGGELLSYVTEMGFEKGQMLWRDGDDAYNASLSLVDTAHEFHVTHWMEKPKPPEENDDSCR